MAFSTSYLLPKGDSLLNWRERLLDKPPLDILDVDLQEKYRVHYYDSFDWLLWRAGKCLEWQERDGDSRLYLHCRNKRTAPLSLALQQVPSRFAGDLPPSPLQRDLAGLLDVRAFLPLASVEIRSWRLRVIDRNIKVRTHLFLEEYRLLGPDIKPCALGKGIRMVVLDGGTKVAKRIAAYLTVGLDLHPQEDDLLGQALARLGRSPGDYSSKLTIALQPDMRADAAMRHILLFLLDTMEANEAGIIADLDSEFLHDFRVAVRRTRSALGQVKSVFTPTVIARFAAKFAWLGTVTTPTRDLDVYVLKFERYQKQLPADLREDLEPLRAFLQRHRDQEHSALCKVLTSAPYRQLKTQWRRYLNSPLPRRPSAVDAASPIAAVAHRRTWRMYKRVLREGQAITPASPAEELHELRKSCKKLRYLMEFFQRLYPAAKIRALINELKELQDNLGDFQDLEVQIHTLAQYREQMDKEGDTGPRTHLAMDTLLDGLQVRMQAVREEFADRFERFARHSNRKRFRHLFHPAEDRSRDGDNHQGEFP